MPQDPTTPIPSSPAEHNLQGRLTEQQKRDFYRDGYLILKGLVPRELTQAAKRRINILAARDGHLFKYYKELSQAPEIPALLNDSALADILANTMGKFDTPERAMPMVLYPAEPSDKPGIHGVSERELPNFGFTPHLDGQWSGALPKSPAEVDNWHSPRTEHFGSGDATSRGANMTPFFQDPECTLSLGSFTAFVGVALNDQSEFGRGNLAILEGAHEKVEAFFRWQRDQGGPIGPEGPGWPRLIPAGNDGVTINLLPQAIKDHYKEGAEYTPDGTMWPKPTPILLEEGDVVITLHAIPHCGTRNFEGSEPRMTVYFRIRRHRPGGARALGDSDHPDREWNGGFIDYAPDYNPWEVAVDALCDHWSEWDGMQEIVAEGRAQAAD